MFYPETHTVPSYVISILPFSVSPSHATFPCSATAYRLHESFFLFTLRKLMQKVPYKMLFMSMVIALLNGCVNVHICSVQTFAIHCFFLKSGV